MQSCTIIAINQHRASSSGDEPPGSNNSSDIPTSIDPLPIVNYHPNHFDKSQANIWFEILENQVPWMHQEIFMFGKPILQPRLTCCYGNTIIEYSGVTMQPNAWLPCLLEIRDSVESLVPGITFNIALLNYYRNGKDYMGWHRDNEKELEPNSPIVSVSLGHSRAFHLRIHKTKLQKTEIDLTSGSVLIMNAAHNALSIWEHALPKRLRVTGGRINITFRVTR